ncbi:ADP-ribosylglycohydrolase [Salinibacter ruber]|uniref:ADP-ribosylglycohydrolase family protein n=1 Tax=Salinibacter ruber TaxID=146919 RepID=UPI002166F3D6|nr:ADP-ribosylglycohydrolase family protein [Salinibacter ruber]MCS3862313.1 ADP-ribosylglycohydrolase [Salinibacter ruber]
MSTVSPPSDSIAGALLGTAVGDALGMPVEGLSHANVRTYYKGIKEYRDDDQRGDLGAGQWTDDTQMTFALVRALTDHPASPDAWPAAVADEYVALRPEARRWGETTTTAVDRLADGTPPAEAGVPDRPTDGAAMRAAPLGVWWAARDLDREAAFEAIRPVLAVTHRHPAALAAGWGQAVAVHTLLGWTPDAFDRAAFWERLVDATAWAEGRLDGDDRVSGRLEALADHLNAFPLNLGDACDGVGIRADEAWPFACAMVARRAHLLENTLLSGINVGGDADTTGAMMGAMLGALHGWSAFPDEWGEGLEAAGRLGEAAQAFADAVRRSA